MTAGTELLTPQQMQQVDATCGIPINVLIERAGLAVAEEIARRYGARKTVVLCGPGNKGRDGAVAARYLQSWGWPVSISDKIGDAELIIDALYGSGLNREFPQSSADAINSAGVPIISIDVPSGLDGLTGHARGACIKANHTITFFRKKPGHVLMPGRSLCGEVVMRDIGISSSALDLIDIKVWENTKPILPTMAADGHKYRRGHALIISGRKFQTGASRLAANAALKIGAGLVTICGAADALAVHASHLTAVMLAKSKTREDLTKLLADKRINAVCIGPAAGAGATTLNNVKAIFESGAATVLDADAITSCSSNPTELFSWISSIQNRPVVMTPHEGEFARIFDGTAPSKLERARAAAKRSGAIIISKGADTVIAHPDGRAKINSNAPSGLATAGTGDVLAGIVTGLLAQGLDGFEAACAAVWLHGDAANKLERLTFTAEDLLLKIGRSK
jgi:ADP-dependent NAD(P)H-hydrate dehydratase / NAD(P)H-hydrate epimerase